MRIGASWPVRLMLPIVPQLIKTDPMENILSLGFIPSAFVSEFKNTENWEFLLKKTVPPRISSM
jgi:hypothetical protein